MECDSESSCEGRVKDLEASTALERAQRVHSIDHSSQRISDSILWHSAEDASTYPDVALNIANGSLSSQVMEYYQKYSQNSNLDQYFSLPTCNATSEGVQYYYSIYELNSKSGINRQDCIGQDYNLKTYIPRERRRWVRPPLIGQSSGADGSSIYTQPLMDPRSASPSLKHDTAEMIPEEKNESQEGISDVSERKVTSPTSSVASYKPLEWDSGADVGYFNTSTNNKRNDKKLSTIERMALARGCSVALRLDPEGTTESGSSNKTQSNSKVLKTPNANSTPLLANVSESEGEIEITPIVKDHLPGVITGDDIKSEEKNTDFKAMKEELNSDTPKSSFAFKVPMAKYAMEVKATYGKQINCNENLHLHSAPLKKCSSMNILAPTPIKLSLKRSQSELNLHVKGKNKMILPLIFNSTSSLATIVNKPVVTCDKDIQTNINTCNRESIGVQVAVLEEEKPLLPKRGTSLTQKSIQSILKNPKSISTKVQDSQRNSEGHRSCNRHGRNECNKENTSHRSSSEISQNESASVTPQLNDTENIVRRANSFEYFPGHIYENVPNGSTSHVSSADTIRSNSTLPNTSSSIDEKLWGDSDSLVRDLERSVNILKSLVDANRCDKQVKKRLIRHVVKRLVTAKYTDDKIEHNLEENVPWNPDDARKKVYRAEIIQALAKNSTDSSDEWKPHKKKKNSSVNKFMENDVRSVKGIINLESSNSDKFDRNTDRTEMDGRKARMGLRIDDCHHSSNTPTDLNKSGSSECFSPQRNKKNELQNTFCFNKQCNLPSEETTSNTIPSDRNRILLEAVVNNRQSSIDSSNGSGISADWKLPTTLSERQFELRRCGNSDSGDTKLVNYAELEKKNQLTWITNEINHLSNLKRLLEQPRKLERQRYSPRKPKHAISKRKPITALTCICGQKEDRDNLQRDTSDGRKNSANEQWSSHCNLATYPTTSTSNKSVKHLRKRNSCTQTATDTTSAHSKTGGEIISAFVHQNPAIRMTNIYVQTLSQQRSPSSVSLHSETAYHVTCKCRKQVLQDTQKMYTYRSQIQNYPQVLSNTCHHVASTSYPKKGRPVLSQFTVPISPDKIDVDIPKPICHHADMDNNNFKQKEAKNKLNKLNATKTKCTCSNEVLHVCQCVGECTCEIKCVKENEIGSKNLSEKMCELCSGSIIQIDADIVECNCNRCKSSNVRRVSCDCPSDCTCESKQKDNMIRCDCPALCNCENKQTSRMQGKGSTCKSCLNCFYNVNGHAHESDNHIKSKKLCACPNDCVCEDKKDEAQSTKKTCECHMNCKCENRNVNQPHSSCRSKLKVCNEPIESYYLANLPENHISQTSRVQNNSKCSCDTDCSCVNNVKGIKKKPQESKHGAKSNHLSETKSNGNDNSCKCCRNCGITYKNERKCECHLRYPKSIAYELSFIKEDEQQNGNKSYPKQGVVEIKTLTKVPSNVPNTAKIGGCSCDEVKPCQSVNNTNQRNTLQDYLATNKPEFVNNIETRRQYISEISHLRELRKEKRVQLLAMASSSNTNNISRSYKPSVRIQRKISDAEMKERLRKRYLRLNEVRTKRRQREKQEEARRNKLMASIFCKKLQQKVLKGQVDLSYSVSVISNL